MSGKSVKRTTDVCCPSCLASYLLQKDNSTSFYCSSCGAKLSCLYCGATRNLTIHTSHFPPYIECGICSEKFWDERYDGHSLCKAPPPVQKKKKPSHREVSTVAECAYCGGEDPHCPYCNVMSKIVEEFRDKSLRCPKCTSRKVIPLKGGSCICMTCQVEFPSNLGIDPPSKIKRPKLITDPKQVRALSEKLLLTCPVCHSKNVAPNINGMNCLSCSAVWHPYPEEELKTSIGTFDFLNDRFWNQPCPNCKQVKGSIARMPNGRLECFLCGHSWRIPISTQLSLKPAAAEDDAEHEDDLGDDASMDDDQDKMCRQKKFNTLCQQCKGGFVEHGRCLRCGAKAAVCDICNLPFEDPSQKSGRCKSCREGKGKVSIACPRCSHSEDPFTADLYNKCHNCEEMYPVVLPVKSFGFPAVVTNEEEMFVRYLERCTDINSAVDDLMSLSQQIQQALLEGKEPLDEFADFESTLQQLSEAHMYIEQGCDTDDTVTEGDLWQQREYEGGEERWREFDTFHHIPRKRQGDYADVTITDAGGDLLEGETCSLHDAHAVASEEDDNLMRYFGTCPKCGGKIDADGYCQDCYELLFVDPIGP